MANVGAFSDLGRVAVREEKMQKEGRVGKGEENGTTPSGTFTLCRSRGRDYAKERVEGVRSLYYV